MIALTMQDSKDNPTVLVNPSQVVAVKPRRGFRPSSPSQAGGISHYWHGAEVTLVNGQYLNVIESVEEVRLLLTGKTADRPAEKISEPAEPVAEKTAPARKATATKTEDKAEG